MAPIGASVQPGPSNGPQVLGAIPSVAYDAPVRRHNLHPSERRSRSFPGRVELSFIHAGRRDSQPLGDSHCETNTFHEAYAAGSSLQFPQEDLIQGRGARKELARPRLRCDRLPVLSPTPPLLTHGAPARLWRKPVYSSRAPPLRRLPRTATKMQQHAGTNRRNFELHPDPGGVLLVGILRPPATNHT
jgi:hypothetical protein